MRIRTAKGVQEFYNLPGISIPHGWAVLQFPSSTLSTGFWTASLALRTSIGTKEQSGRNGASLVILLFLGAILGIAVGAVGGLWRDPVCTDHPRRHDWYRDDLDSKDHWFLHGSPEPDRRICPRIHGQEIWRREIYIGLDSAVLIGHPVTVAAAVILIPIVLGLALILPGNRVLPFGDLAALFYFVAMVPFMAKGNLFRSVISGIFVMTVVLYVCTSFGSSLTEMAGIVNYEIPAGAVDITAMSAGNWVSWVMFQLSRLVGG